MLAYIPYIIIWLVVSNMFYVPFHKKGMSSFPIDEVHHFSRWLKSPTSIGIQLIDDGWFIGQLPSFTSSPADLTVFSRTDVGFYSDVKWGSPSMAMIATIHALRWKSGETAHGCAKNISYGWRNMRHVTRKKHIFAVGYLLCQHWMAGSKMH